MKPVLAEILKLRGSTSWAVVVLLPVASVVSACIFVRPDGWRLLWIRSVGFYGMALLPVGLAVLASLVWRVEHRGSNWNVLMSTPVPTWRTVVAKTAAIWLLASGMQLVLVLAVTAVDVGALDLLLSYNLLIYEFKPSIGFLDFKFLIRLLKNVFKCQIKKNQ